jgi:hypothetical protein
MKKVILIAAVLLSVSAKAQIKEIQTKKLLVGNSLMYFKYDIKMYEDSITIELKGGLGTARAIKSGNVKTVYISKVKAKDVGASKVYTYQTEEARVVVTDSGNKSVINLDIKDTFTGAITKCTYL